jgi:hypothetical protein
MSLEQLTSAWEKPFLPVAQGGCPAVTATTPWFERRQKAAAPELIELAGHP